MTPRERNKNLPYNDWVEWTKDIEPGQYRFWFKGTKNLGPVKLLRKSDTPQKELSGPIEPHEAIWECERLTRNEVRLIGEFSLGEIANEMEVIAWSAQ